MDIREKDKYKKVHDFLNDKILNDKKTDEERQQEIKYDFSKKKKGFDKITGYYITCVVVAIVYLCIVLALAYTKTFD
jgi:hypothetical protein